MALKIALVVSLIFALFIAEAPLMEAQAVSSILSVVQVTLSGLRNTITGLAIENTTSPIFSGALAQVRVGTRPLSVGVTDSTGSMNITLSPTLLGTNVNNLVNSLVRNGTIRILTSVRNETTGLLTAPLQLTGNITRGVLNIITLSPNGFTLVV